MLFFFIIFVCKRYILFLYSPKESTTFSRSRTIGTKDTPFFVRSLFVVNYLHTGGDGEGDEAEGHDEPEEVLVADVLGDET